MFLAGSPVSGRLEVFAWRNEQLGLIMREQRRIREQEESGNKKVIFHTTKGTLEVYGKIEEKLSLRDRSL